MSNLSHIIQSAPKISVFDKLITLPETETNLSQYDFMKIHKVIDDIGLYLKELESVFNNLQIMGIHDLNWYFEGRNEVAEINQNMETIDAILSRLLVVIDSSENAKHIQFNHLLTKFEETSDLLLQIKKSILLIKHKVDISINYRELNDITIASLNTEIESCLQIYFKLQDIKMLSTKDPPKFNLQELISKMKINNSAAPSNFTLKSINLPTFNDLDETLYNNYLILESKLKPLQVSVEFLPLRIEEFISICTHGSNKNLFPESLEEINKSYETLLDKYEYLTTRVNGFKAEEIDMKWNEVFIFLIEEIIKLTRELLEEFQENPNKRITKTIGDNYRTCFNTLTIIKSAVNERILYGSKLINLFNDILLPNWNQLNDVLTSNKRSDEINDTYHEYNGLRSFQTRKRGVPKVNASPIKLPTSSSSSSSNTVPAGLGIDLGLDVKNSHVPFSIRPTNKIIDVQQDYNIPKSTKNLMQELGLSKRSTDDEATLVPRTPKKPDMVNSWLNKTTIDLKKHPDNLEKVITKLDHQLHKLDIKDLLKPKDSKTRIPRVRKDYIKLGLPRIIQQFDKKSKIPKFVKRRTYKTQLESPIQLQKTRIVRSISSTYPSKVTRSPTPKSRFGNDDDFRKIRSPSYNFVSPVTTGNTPINLGTTPNLSYPQSSPSYSSTSPDRPTSSIGSRFDDEHLLQPLKHIKPAWK